MVLCGSSSTSDAVQCGFCGGRSNGYVFDIVSASKCCAVVHSMVVAGDSGTCRPAVLLGLAASSSTVLCGDSCSSAVMRADCAAMWLNVQAHLPDPTAAHTQLCTAAETAFLSLHLHFQSNPEALHTAAPAAAHPGVIPPALPCASICSIVALQHTTSANKVVHGVTQLSNGHITPQPAGCSSQDRAEANSTDT